MFQNEALVFVPPSGLEISIFQTKSWVAVGIQGNLISYQWYSSWSGQWSCPCPRTQSRSRLGTCCLPVRRGRCWSWGRSCFLWGTGFWPRTCRSGSGWWSATARCRGGQTSRRWSRIPRSVCRHRGSSRRRFLWESGSGGEGSGSEVRGPPLVSERERERERLFDGVWIVPKYRSDMILGRWVFSERKMLPTCTTNANKWTLLPYKVPQNDAFYFDNTYYLSSRAYDV